MSQTASKARQQSKRPESAAQLVAENAALRAELEEIKQQLDWFKRQLFGEKSEKRIDIDPQVQPDLLATAAEPEPVKTTTSLSESITYQRRKKQRAMSDVADVGLRFDDTVPVTVVKITPDEANSGDYITIGERVIHRLCQRPGNVEVIEYRCQTIKRKDDGKVFSVGPPPAVLERTAADVSLLAGLLVDKFTYHLPLYRQHQRLKASGVTLSRATLTNWTQRAIALLEPIYDAQVQNVLRSRVLAMDETPIKAGRKAPGKLKQCYFWPIYGAQDEIVFPFSPTKSKAQLNTWLADWSGDTLLTDGYEAYARYAAANAKVTHAECWAHTRRYFDKAKGSQPHAAAEAIQQIGTFYHHEQQIRQQELTGQDKLEYRTAHTLPLVQAFWAWCDDQVHRKLEPSDPLAKALKYAMSRQEALQVFLSDPEVAIDTNHVERNLRNIPMGRKNYLFCWTELGAKHVGIIQSLLVTCKLHGIRPHDYLVDVLQRVSEHPAKDVAQLTPRLWKTTFKERYTSDLSYYVYNVGE